MDRKTALAVAQAAHKAAAAGKTIRDCPYDVDGDPEQRFKARYWTLGFQQAQKDSAGR
jgi:hypothetical protein